MVRVQVTVAVPPGRLGAVIVIMAVSVPNFGKAAGTRETVSLPVEEPAPVTDSHGLLEVASQRRG